MPRPRARLDHAAMADAFAPDGLHGARSSEIARCAGVAKPTLYVHGRSKESLYLACVQAEVERLLDRISRAERDTRALSPAHRVTELVRAVIAHADAHPSGARLLFVTARHASSAVAGDVDAALARIPARIADVLRRDLGPGEDGVAAGVARALLGAAAALALAPPGELDELCRRLGEAFAGMLAAGADAESEAHVTTVGFY